jgi:hypothetical protein
MTKYHPHLTTAQKELLAENEAMSHCRSLGFVDIEKVQGRGPVDFYMTDPKTRRRIGVDSKYNSGRMRGIYTSGGCSITEEQYDLDVWLAAYDPSTGLVDLRTWLTHGVVTDKCSRYNWATRRGVASAAGKPN